MRGDVSGKVRVWQTISYFLIYIPFGYVMASLGPLLPVIAQQTHSSLSLLGLLFTARSLGFLSGAFVGGHLFDRWAGNRVVAYGLATMALVFAFMPFQGFFWQVAVIIMVLGWAMGVLDVGGNTMLLWIHGAEVTPFINGLHAFFGLGALIAPFVIMEIETWCGNVQWAYWLASLALCLGVVWFYFFLPSPPVQVGSVARQDRGANWKAIALLAAFLFFYMGLEVSFGGWIFTYAITNGMTKAAASILNSCFWLSMIVGRLVYVPLGLKVKPYWIILMNLGGVIGSLLLLIGNGALPAAVWCGTTALGFFLGSVLPMTFAFAKSQFEITGRKVRWLFVGSTLGAMLIPWLIGGLLQKYNPSRMMVFLLGDVGLGALVFLWLVRMLKPAAGQAQTDITAA